MFKSATFKLTGWYLAFVMGLSLAFSFVLYQASSESLNSGFDRQRTAIRQEFQNYGLNLSPFDMDRLRDQEVASAQQQLIARLTLANIAVLVIGGAACFYLARRTLQPIERALEAQTRFTTDASHELRTPLTAIQTEIEVTLRDKSMTASELRKQLSSCLEEVVKLQSLSNSLLALANQDQEHFVPKKVPMRSVVYAAIGRISKAAEQKDIRIENKCDELHVYGDRDGLIQLFAILLDNAVKYSPTSSTVEITTVTKGDIAMISVTDHGQGISPADLPHIFDRLYRADTSRSKDVVDGYGLGLSIAKKIVELHKGAIDVTSRVGKGSVFTVRIPLVHKAPSHDHGNNRNTNK